VIERADFLNEKSSKHPQPAKVRLVKRHDNSSGVTFVQQGSLFASTSPQVAAKAVLTCDCRRYE